MSSRLDQLLNLTQSERLKQSVNQSDLKEYLDQIARLKKSESSLKLKLRQQ